MALFPAFPVKSKKAVLTTGRGKKDCVLTRELTYLTGSVDTAGCQVDFGGKTYNVTAVLIRKKWSCFDGRRWLRRKRLFLQWQRAD